MATDSHVGLAAVRRGEGVVPPIGSDAIWNQNVRWTVGTPGAERVGRGESTVAGHVFLDAVGVEALALTEPEAHEGAAWRKVAAEQPPGIRTVPPQGTRRGEMLRSFTLAGTITWTCPEEAASVVESPS